MELERWRSVPDAHDYLVSDEGNVRRLLPGVPRMRLDHLDKHHAGPVADNSRRGPGRGPAPAPGPERWWWRRWRMFDELLWAAVDHLTPEQYAYLTTHWPAGWPSLGSGHLSIRQMEWVRVHMIAGRPLDVKGRLFA